MTETASDLADFEALFASHGGRLKSLAFNLLGNRSDAEDAVQEAFVRAYQRRRSFRGDASLATWVSRILLNTCHDMGRRRSRQGTRECSEEEATALRAPRVDHPLRLALQRALAELAPIYRDVFLLCEVEGYLHREVAAVLEIPEGTSRARLSEARRQLRVRMQDSVSPVSSP